jgi:hypothetical protein
MPVFLFLHAFSPPLDYDRAQVHHHGHTKAKNNVRQKKLINWQVDLIGSIFNYSTRVHQSTTFFLSQSFFEFTRSIGQKTQRVFTERKQMSPGKT